MGWAKVIAVKQQAFRKYFDGILPPNIGRVRGRFGGEVIGSQGAQDPTATAFLWTMIFIAFCSAAIVLLAMIPPNERATRDRTMHTK